MSNKHLFLKSGFIRTPLENGLGRYVCQLQRITIKFCKSWGTSRGVREFIEHDLLDFAKENPGVVVYLKPRRHRGPVLAAEYLNGTKYNFYIQNYTREEVLKWINMLRTQTEDKSDFRYRKLWHTDHPSIQGPWTPFTFKDPKLNLASFPNEELSKPYRTERSATEMILEMFKKQQEEAKAEETKEINDK